MPLSDTAARQAKFTGKQQKLSDEKGLFLLITSSGKYWRLKFRFGGKEKVLALGVYCSGQLNPDTWLGRTSAFAGVIPSLC